MTGFGIIQRKIMQDTVLTPTAKAIYSFLASYAGSDGSCFPKVSTIMHFIGISKGTYYRHITILKERGYISTTQMREKDKFGRVLYVLTSDNIATEKDNIDEKNISIDEQCTNIEDTHSQDTDYEDTENSHIIYTNNSITNNSNTNTSIKNNNFYKNPSINHISEQKINNDTIDGLKKQIDYEILKTIVREDDCSVLDIIINFMAEMICGSVKIGDYYQSPEVMRPIIKEVNSDIILEFIDYLQGKKLKGVKNIYAYMRTCFFNFIMGEKLRIASIENKYA